MKIRKGKFSGAIGNEVYVNTRTGQVVRSRPRRRPRATPARLRAQSNLPYVAAVWRTLTDEQFAAWEAAAKQEKKPPYRYFCQVNGTLTAYGQPLLLFPPKRQRLRPNPVGALEIRIEHGHLLMRLRVPTAPAPFTFVFGVPWCSRGISVPRSNPVLLGPLPAPVDGWSDITDLYVKKFGQPPPNSRIFIGTRQVLAGRKTPLKLTRADVRLPATRPN